MFLLSISIILPAATMLDILRAHQAGAAPVASTDAPAESVHRFGPTREITLPRSHPRAYDFDHERFVDYVPSPKSPHGIGASLLWHADHGTDVFNDPNSYLPGVLLLGTDLSNDLSAGWEASADEAAGHRGKPDQGRLSFLPASPGRPPETRVYRTPQGTAVVIQLLHSNDAGDVILRYKTILGPSSPPVNTPAIFAEDQRALHFDRAGDTMQNIVHRLRQDHGLRISFENLDFTTADAKTAAQIIAEADRNAPYSKLEEALLQHARAAKDPDTLIDLGERYKGKIHGDSVPEFLARLTADTPYVARKIGVTWLIQPRSGSRLAFPVTLKTAGMTVSEALVAIARHAPAEHPIAVGMVFAMPVAPGMDPTPWLSVQAPKLDFKGIPAFEALCKLTETSQLGFVWELAGYRGSRVLSTAPAPNDEGKKP